MGIKQIIVAINKMDACDYSEQRYNEIEEEMRKFIKNKDLNQKIHNLQDIQDIQDKIQQKDMKMVMLQKQIKCHGIKVKHYQKHQMK